MKKIDIHCHTTNRKVKDVVSGNATLDDIAREMERHDVVKTVVLATYFPHKTSGISNFRLLHWIRDRPEFCMFGSLDFEHYFYQGMNELTELAECGLMKGIKIYTCYQNVGLDSDRFKKVMGLAREYSLPMMFHCGYSYASQRKYGKIAIADVVQVADLEHIAKENPEVDIIASHMSKPFFDDLVRVVKSNPNVYTDMSGLIDSKFDREEMPRCVEEIKRFLGECGPERLMFGTDFPVQTHADSVYFIEESMRGYSVEDRADVYFNNAERMLRI